MVCWTGRRQVAHGKAQSQTHENYDCGHGDVGFGRLSFSGLIVSCFMDSAFG